MSPFLTFFGLTRIFKRMGQEVFEVEATMTQLVAGDRSQNFVKALLKTTKKQFLEGDKTARGDINPLWFEPAFQFLARSTDKKTKTSFSFPPSHFGDDAVFTEKATKSEKCVDDLEKGLWKRPKEGEKASEKVSIKERECLTHPPTNRFHACFVFSTNLFFPHRKRRCESWVFHPRPFPTTF